MCAAAGQRQWGHARACGAQADGGGGGGTHFLSAPLIRSVVQGAIARAQAPQAPHHPALPSCLLWCECTAVVTNARKHSREGSKNRSYADRVGSGAARRALGCIR